MTKHIKVRGQPTVHIVNKFPCPKCGGRMYKYSVVTYTGEGRKSQGQHVRRCHKCNFVLNNSKKGRKALEAARNQILGMINSGG